MKFINRLGLAILGFALFPTAYAQDTTDVAMNNERTTNSRQKIDGVIATIGDYIILESDIDKMYLEMTSQGNAVSDIPRCQVLGMLMEDKLYAHHAVQDSINVTDGEVRERLNKQLGYMVEQLKSIDNVVKYFKKNSEEEFRSDLFDIIKTNMLTEQMRRKIIDGVEITPEEVRTFFKKIPADQLPTFGAEMEVAQIVVQPEVTMAEKQKVIDRLNEFKKEIEAGGSFFGKAVLYTDDKASSASGGFYKINRKTPFVKEFKDVAFSLGEGEISEPFETEHGFHIILVEKIRGQEIDLRHILLIPRVSEDALKAAKDKATLIRKRIAEGEVTFAEAARQLSDEKETRANGGLLVNPQTQDTRFELTKMDPSLYGQVANLKEGEVSQPVLDETQAGKKRFKILTVTNRFDEHVADYSIDYIRIKELALKEKQIKEIGKWSNEKITDTYVKINGEYRDCTFTNNWLKK